NMIYIILSKNLELIKGIASSNFHLLRCKINNVFEFELKYENKEQAVIKKKNYNIELIDVAIPTPDDTYMMFLNQFSYEGSKKTKQIKLTGNKYITETEIPSPHYMFQDLCTIILKQAIFPWEDPKYQKRIKRVFIITIICLLEDNVSATNMLDNIYRPINKLFNELNKINTLSEKLEYIKNDYEIIIDPNKNKYNEKMARLLTSDISDKLRKNFALEHQLITIKNNSQYKSKYLEFILSKYIEIILILQYLVNNESPQYKYV